MSDLALFGGEPVRKTPFSLWPRVVNGQKEKLVNTLLNDSWGIGSETIKELEISLQYSKMQKIVSLSILEPMHYGLH